MAIKVTEEEMARFEESKAAYPYYEHFRKEGMDAERLAKMICESIKELEKMARTNTARIGALRELRPWLEMIIEMSGDKPADRKVFTGEDGKPLFQERTPEEIEIIREASRKLSEKLK